MNRLAIPLLSSLVALATFLAAPPAIAREAIAPKSYLPPAVFSLAEPDFLDSYGLTVAADSDYAFIGVPLDNNALVFTPGMVEVYVRSGTGWTLTQSLTPADGTAGDEFGRGLAVRGDLAVIGAPARSQRRGAAYVYRRIGGAWTLETTLLPADPQADSGFGSSAAIDGDTVVIGAPGYNQRRGAAYVFARSQGSWAQQARLAPSPSELNDDFGVSLQLDQGDLLVGASGADTQASPQDNVGAVYVFHQQGSSWSQAQRLVRPTGTANQAFGLTLAIAEGRAAIGAPFANVDGLQSAGVVLTYRRHPSGWMMETELRSSSPGASQFFGYSVDLLGERLLIGEPRGSVGAGTLPGAAEVVLDEFGTWLPVERLSAPVPSSNARFGDAVALADDFALIGAPQTNNFEGAAYAFENRSTMLQFAALPSQPIRVGAPYLVGVTLSASAGSPSGSVTLRDDQDNSCEANLQAGAGSCTLIASAVGPRALRARYNGAPGFAESFAQATVQVTPDLRLQPDSLPEGQIGVAYSQLFDTAGTGATLPLTYSLTSGNLPPGLNLGGNGLLSGTPADFGSYSFTVRVSDSSSAALGGPFNESRAYTLLIQPPFRTSLDLAAVASPRDRGATIAFDAQLDVIEAGAGAPSGTYQVAAVNGASSLSCSAVVTAEGLQTCSIDFGLTALVGDYAISASFNSSNADFGNSSDSDSLRLLSASDPSVTVTALDPLFVPEDPLRFRIDVQNGGPDVAYALRMQAPAPTGLNTLSWTCSGAACPAASGSGAPDLQIDALPAGAGLQIELTGQLVGPAPAQVNASAGVSLDTAGFSRDLDLSNNAASAQSLPLRLFADGFEAPEI